MVVMRFVLGTETFILIRTLIVHLVGSNTVLPWAAGKCFVWL
jgi:hypothetical protein